MRCIGCGASGEARDCCEDKPVMCASCFGTHQSRIHPIDYAERADALTKNSASTTKAP